MNDLLLDVLAVFRLTRLAHRDAITAPARDWIEARSVEVTTQPKVTTLLGAKITQEYATGVRDVQPYAFARDLLDCGWCTSVWAAGAILLLRVIPGGRTVRNVLAVAGAAGLIGLLDREPDWNGPAAP